MCPGRLRWRLFWNLRRRAGRLAPCCSILQRRDVGLEFHSLRATPQRKVFPLNTQQIHREVILSRFSAWYMVPDCWLVVYGSDRQFRGLRGGYVYSSRHAPHAQGSSSIPAPNIPAAGPDPCPGEAKVSSMQSIINPQRHSTLAMRLRIMAVWRWLCTRVLVVEDEPQDSSQPGED